LITAICWPLAPVDTLEIAPIVAPVLSFTGSPTVSAAGAAAPERAVALVSDGEPVGELPGDVLGVVEAGGWVVRLLVAGGVDCIGASVPGMFDEPEAVGLAARAWPAIATARPAEIRSAERNGVSP
jgi:hypothetical protein